MRFIACTCVVLLAASASVLVTACKKAPSSQGSAKTAAVAPMPTQEVLAPKKPRLKEAMIYVDGTPLAAIRSTELPAGLKMHDSMTGGSPNYYLGEYVRALGVDVAKVKALHVYGGTRVVTLDGTEFRRVQDGVHFSFSRGAEGGKPRIMFAVTDLKADTTVDMISAITVYVDKEAPTLQNGDLAFADGKPIVGIPYAPAEISKGTRVYVDGKLAATVKRKELPNGLLVDSSVENPRFSLPGYLTSIGVDAKQAKAMDFVRDDEVILRVDGKAGGADKLAFSLPRHNHGQIAMPAGDSKAAKVSALQIFVKNTPPARTIVLPKNDVNADSNSNNSGGGQGGGGGGDDDEL